MKDKLKQLEGLSTHYLEGIKTTVEEHFRTTKKLVQKLARTEKEIKKILEVKDENIRNVSP